MIDAGPSLFDFLLPSDEVLVAVEHLGGALLDLLGDPVAQLVVPGLGAVAHPHLQRERKGRFDR